MSYTIQIDRVISRAIVSVQFTKGQELGTGNMTTENGQVRVENGVPEDEDVVTPWIVTSTNDTGIDYDKLIGELSRYILRTK